MNKLFLSRTKNTQSCARLLIISVEKVAVKVFFCFFYFSFKNPTLTLIYPSMKEKNKRLFCQLSDKTVFCIYFLTTLTLLLILLLPQFRGLGMLDVLNLD